MPSNLDRARFSIGKLHPPKPRESNPYICQNGDTQNEDISAILMERHVLREELLSSESSSDIDSGTEARERLKRLGELQYDFRDVAEVQSTERLDQDKTEDDAVEFRLFGPAETSDAARQMETALKIRLRSPSNEAAEPGFLNPRREQSYYFTRKPSPQTKSEYQLAAVTGGEVISRSQSPWPGASYPWKVLHLPLSGLTKAARSNNGGLLTKLVSNGINGKRCRPGKKTRLRRRAIAADAKAKQAAAQLSAKAKEAEEREKRTRRNREKKVKKKARDKAKKDVTGDASDLT